MTSLARRLLTRQRGQDQWPRGIAESGGIRQRRWYTSTHVSHMSSSPGRRHVAQMSSWLSVGCTTKLTRLKMTKQARNIKFHTTQHAGIWLTWKNNCQTFKTNKKLISTNEVFTLFTAAELRDFALAEALMFSGLIGRLCTRAEHTNQLFNRQSNVQCIQFFCNTHWHSIMRFYTYVFSAEILRLEYCLVVIFFATQHMAAYDYPTRTLHEMLHFTIQTTAVKQHICSRQCQSCRSETANWPCCVSYVPNDD